MGAILYSHLSFKKKSSLKRFRNGMEWKKIDFSYSAFLKCCLSNIIFCVAEYINIYEISTCIIFNTT